MNDKNKRIWFEATDGNGGWEYPTMKGAVEQLTSMSKGFPENKFMSEENRRYWIKARSRYFIIKVSRFEDRII